VETLDHYLERLASDAPTPGGGSAAAVVGALASALIAMVARISARNPKHEQRAERIVKLADELRSELARARERDEWAFEDVVAAQALPKGDAAESAARQGALQTALARAAEEPLYAALIALGVLDLAARALEISTRDLISDVGCAAELAHAAILACAYNVRVNHRFMRDRDAVAAGEQRLRTIEDDAHALLERVRAAIQTTATT
jgi:formiminotetrahydrofolate cyclodeaminase